ncbi:translationally-controlled tumor protein homolog [Galendromus occidentalis]|uniref:Translationally-controlled tumor protein homolog n=1 Tax=Galendromus occidentalis TaxID=34638 RepID=A0AAJ6QYN9_9ACAR|nr:translationally-controlled tumor protein homolog [Galendromus occidentalis]
MLIYKDIISNDEMFTDTTKVTLVENSVYEVLCKHVVRREGEIVLAGSNPSAEEADEGADDSCQAGLDVVLNQRLQETSFDKAGYKTYLKTYTKALQEKWKELEYSDEKIAELKSSCMAGVKFMLSKMDKDSQYFLGESMNPDGMVAVLNYRDGEDGNEEAIMMFLKAGLEEEKC